MIDSRLINNLPCPTSPYSHIKVANIFIAGSSINYFISVGVMKLFGMLYSELLETYDSAAGSTAFINSLQIFIMAAVSKLM